jgi:hypothetical protein
MSAKEQPDNHDKVETGHIYNAPGLSFLRPPWLKTSTGMAITASGESPTQEEEHNE